MYRPKDWKNPYLEATVVDRERLIFRLPDNGIYIEGIGKDIGTNAFEAGADAAWLAVSNQIADMSREIRDDKDFRLRLFLWLGEVKDDRKQS